MRMLLETRDRDELSKLRERLEGNGIPVWTESTEMPSRWGTVSKNAMMGLYVCLDEQFGDAQILLNNPKHKVERQVDVLQFYKDSYSPFTLSMPTLVTLLGICVLAYLLLKWAGA